mgnify:CR=1 FL=1
MTDIIRKDGIIIITIENPTRFENELINEFEKRSQVKDEIEKQWATFQCPENAVKAQSDNNETNGQVSMFTDNEENPFLKADYTDDEELSLIHI